MIKNPFCSKAVGTKQRPITDNGDVSEYSRVVCTLKFYFIDWLLELEKCFSPKWVNFITKSTHFDKNKFGIYIENVLMQMVKEPFNPFIRFLLIKRYYVHAITLD